MLRRHFLRAKLAPGWQGKANSYVSRHGLFLYLLPARRIKYLNTPNGVVNPKEIRLSAVISTPPLGRAAESLILNMLVLYLV